MRDEPGPIALLKIVAETLHADVVPSLTGAPAYQARIAASLVTMVLRELQHGSAADDREAERLKALLGVSDGKLPELNRELAAHLRSGTMALEDSDVAKHLWQTVMDKLAVDQPTFARYRQLRT